MLLAHSLLAFATLGLVTSPPGQRSVRSDVPALMDTQLLQHAARIMVAWPHSARKISNNATLPERLSWSFPDGTWLEFHVSFKKIWQNKNLPWRCSDQGQESNFSIKIHPAPGRATGLPLGLGPPSPLVHQEIHFASSKAHCSRKGSYPANTTEKLQHIKLRTAQIGKGQC